MTGESIPKFNSVDTYRRVMESASNKELGEFEIDRVLCDPLMFKI